jgi:cold shock CspA family protein
VCEESPLSKQQRTFSSLLVMAPKLTGVVQSFEVEKSSGVLRKDGCGTIISFGSAGIADGKPLPQGQKVEFDMVYGPNGPELSNITSV